MTATKLDLAPAVPGARLLAWFRRRWKNRRNADPLKLLDELNDRLLRDIGYQRHPQVGLRSGSPTLLWMASRPS